MSRHPPATVLRRYYLYSAAARPNFHYPVYTLFLLFNDLTFAQIGLIATIQSIVVVVGEVPTGYVGDRIGRRNSLVIGALLLLVSNSSYVVATDFVGFAFTFVMLSFGGTFLSGSRSAWLYDTLHEHGLEDEFTHVQGRSSAIAKWVQVVTLPVGGLLYSIDRFYPFYAGIVAASISLLLVARLPKNRMYDEAYAAEGGAGADGSDRLTVVDAIPVIRDQLRAPSLRWFIVYLALFGGAVWTMDMWIQPIAKESLKASFGPLLESWGLTEGVILGLLYSSFTLVSAVASDYASDVEEVLGVRRSMMLIPAAIAASYVLANFWPVLAFPMFFMMKGGGSITGPIQNRYLNEQVESVGRATVLSSVNMVRQVAGIPFRVGSGILAGMFTSLTAVAILGGIFLVGAALMWSFVPPISRDFERSAPDVSVSESGVTED